MKLVCRLLLYHCDVAGEHNFGGRLGWVEFEPRVSLHAKLLLSLPDLPRFPRQCSSRALSVPSLYFYVVVYLQSLG